METDSDSESLKTDNDDTPPPTQGKTRNSMDETEESSLQPISPLPSSADQQQQSPSPRPPPNEPPPPVPPTAPKQKQIEDTSNSILLNLDELEANNAKSNYSRGRNRRRRASLPSINILPSFKSLKSVMGFGVDEDDKNSNDESKENSQDQKQTKQQKIITTNDTQKQQQQNEQSQQSGNGNKTLNKKLNPKEIKQLYIKNLKLQSQLDKYKEREKEFELKMEESADSVLELQTQVNMKTQVLQQLNDQISNLHLQIEEMDDLKMKLTETENKLKQKDEHIKSLNEQMSKIQKIKNTLQINQKQQQQSMNPTPSPSPIGINDAHKLNTDHHNRSATLTPGGYALVDSIPWYSPASGLDTDHLSSSQSQTSSVRGMTLNEKFGQRPSWIELRQRGILFDDPTSDIPHMTQSKQRKKHKRKASQTLTKFINNRPKPKQLFDTNILKILPDDTMNDVNFAKNAFGRFKPTQIKVDNGLNLLRKLQQRASWKELRDRGILYDDPTTNQSHGLQAAQRQLHKRKASKTLDKFLMSRPTPNDLHRDNIINANTASLFFNSTPLTKITTPIVEENVVSDIDDEYKSFIDQHIIYKDNVNKSDIAQKMEIKLRQRPSMSDTISRGILLHRTDNRINYDLQMRHKQLHKRKASQTLEKFMKFKRPSISQLEDKGILIGNSEIVEKKQIHKRQKSLKLEAGLKRRMSISEMQGLGLLFMDHGIEFDAPSDEELGNNEYMDDEEQQRNIAGLFKQKPRTSKPLQETDFKGIEFMNEEEEEIKQNNKRRDSVDQTFEPFKLSKKEKIKRLSLKLGQRASVSEMKMRGILYEHPTISHTLLERKRSLMKRRASNKVESLLLHRPKRKELENRNILLQEHETLDKRKRHKRKRSQNLEVAIQRRPKMMEEKEAHRQRKRSMTDSDFTPDYLSHLFDDVDDSLNNIDDDDYKSQQQQQPDFKEIDIRFLNIGGYVIPLVSPKFMSDLAGNDNTNDSKEENDSLKRSLLEKDENIESLDEKLEDLEQDLLQQKAVIKNREDQIKRLKKENASLKQQTSRQSLSDSNSNSLYRIKVEEKQKKIESLENKINGINAYIEKLSFYFAENANISMPTPKELKQKTKNKLLNHFKQRPSFRDLTDKQILSSNFINDVTNQNAQIAAKKLKFRRTSQLIETFLSSRPSKESLKQYFLDNVDYENYQSELRENDDMNVINGDDVMVDNATKSELRQEVLRLNAMLAQKIVINKALEKENENMKFKLSANLDKSSSNMARGLKEFSISDSEVLNQSLLDLSKESDENKINELERENEKLQQKIRRLSTVDFETEFDAEANNMQQSELKKLVEWSMNLTWPKVISDVYVKNVHKNDYFALMQSVFMQQQDINESNESNIESMNERINAMNDEIRSLHIRLNKQREEHLRDKERFAVNTANELNRLREAIKHVGKRQQSQQQQTTTNGNYYSYLSNALWKK